MKAIFIFIAVAAGVGSALQAGSNATLQKALASPPAAMVLISAVTLAAALLVATVMGAPLPAGAGAGLAKAPWWAWIGGVFGLGFLLATVYASPKLGAGLFVGLVVTASTLASLVLDHFGLMGFDVHKAGAGRIVGGILMALGVAMIAAF